MTPEEILRLLDQLDPEGRNISTALAFLRLVVHNNPGASAADLLERRDVRDAVAVLQEWNRDVGTAATAIAVALPRGAARAVRTSVDQTLERLSDETALTDARIGEWSQDDLESGQSWAATIVLRMRWLLDWLRAQVEMIRLSAPYKRWVSRLAPNTCRFCRSLHGAVIPAGASFSVEARKAGFTRIYGGLYAPPLHPRCQCILVPVSQEEYEALADTSGERSPR